MGYLSHPYAWRLASASFAGATIERLQYRDTLEVVIRFADWRGRRFNPKALEIGEDELLVLIGDAIAKGVLSLSFASELRHLTQENTSMKVDLDAPATLIWLSTGITPTDADFAATELPWTLEEAVKSACDSERDHDRMPWIKVGDNTLDFESIKQVRSGLRAMGRHR